MYSRANPDYAVPLHELTHQMVSQYFGLYYVHFFIPQWKDEGYAEYMSAIGCYNNPQELLELLACFRVPDEKVSHPFAQGLRNSSTHDYIAALIQTKYALEHLHMNPRDFFSPFYKNRSSEEIYSWLHRESLYNSEGFS